MEQSIVRKTESAIDDIADLWRRRKLICALVFAVIVIPSGFSLYLNFIAIPRLKADSESKSAAIADLKRERDKFELKLTSFQAAADNAFPDKNKEERMALLINLLNQIGFDLQRVLPYQMSDVQRTTLQAKVAGITKQESSQPQSPPALHFLKFPGQSEDAAEFMDFLQKTFNKAGRTAESHTNLGLTGLTTDDNKPWSGVVISVNDLNNPPFVARALLQLFTEQGLQVITREGSGYGQNAVVIFAHRLAYSVKDLNRRETPSTQGPRTR